MKTSQNVDLLRWDACRWTAGDFERRYHGAVANSDWVEAKSMEIAFLAAESEMDATAKAVGGRFAASTPSTYSLANAVLWANELRLAVG